MISTGIRDLENNLSRPIRRLKVEKRIAVTDRGAAVAELRFSEEGWSVTLPAGTVTKLIDEDRGDR
jgi:hypothetical protein